MLKLKFITTSLLIFSFYNNCWALSDNEKQQLTDAAVKAAHNSHSPYSKYPVGAALLCKKQHPSTTIVGTNVENASYGLTVCAERSAVFSAVSQGHKDFDAIAIVTKDGGLPCGACRQVLNEFNPDINILIADLSGTIKRDTTLSQLLPDAFGPHNL